MKETYTQKHPYSAAILIALLCTFLTALGAAVSQVMELDSDTQLVVITAFLLFSVVIGLWVYEGERK